MRSSGKIYYPMSISATGLVFYTVFGSTAMSQESIKNGSVSPMGRWLEHRKTTYTGEPILIHLRTGYERAIVMPEKVELRDGEQHLPDFEIKIEDHVIAFYPIEIFTRRPVFFIGKETGTIYELRVRASTEGIRQPLKINR